MKLYAISDLHLANRVNFDAVNALPFYPDDWLILAGDIGETEEHLQYALMVLGKKFKQLVWVPGNHDLWTLPSSGYTLRGEYQYQRMVSICRRFGVITPEEPYPIWEGSGGKHLLVPMFLLYDYSFRPRHVPESRAVDWAAESGVVCTDEELLHPDPYMSRIAWCRERCEYTEQRLQEAALQGIPMVLINHFPLRSEMANIRRFPRFSLWCGTHRTENWHTRFPVSAVVYGHMHMRGTHYRDGVRFEEVSLGYPRDWTHNRGLGYYLREILPAPDKISPSS